MVCGWVDENGGTLEAEAGGNTGTGIGVDGDPELASGTETCIVSDLSDGLGKGRTKATIQEGTIRTRP